LGAHDNAGKVSGLIRITNTTVNEEKGMDRFSQLALDAELVLFILGNEATGDWELADPADTARTYSERGLIFGGLCGIVNGVPRVVLELELPDPALKAVGEELVRRFARMIARPPRWRMQSDVAAN
jgi:hypothetical protein